MTIKSIQNNDTIDSYETYEKSILNSLNLGCDSYIVYNSNLEYFLESYDFSVQRTPQNKGKRKFIYVLDYVDIDLKTITDFLNSHVLRYIPDFIVIYPNETAASNSSLIHDLKNNAEIYKIITREMDDPAVVLLDYWYSSNRSFLFNNNLFPDKVKNLHNTPLNVSSIDNYLPYVILKTDLIIYPNKEPETLADGIEIQVFREYANKYNITLSFVLEPDLWGDVFPNYTGIGLFGNVVENKFDAAIGALSLWEEGARYTESAVITVHTLVKCLVPIPMYVEKFNLVFLPFTFTLWIAVLFSILMLTIVLNYVSYATRGSINYNFKETISPTYFGILKNIVNKAFTDFSTAFYNIYAVTLLQPISDSFMNSDYKFRGLVAIILWQVILMSAAYTGGLSTILTLPQYEKPIRTIQDLIDSKMEWGGNDKSWVEPMFISDDVQILDLLKTFKIYPEDVIKNFPPRTFGYVMDELNGGSFGMPSYVTDEIIKRSQMMEEYLIADGLQAIFRKSSPFLPQYNTLIHKLHESGILYVMQSEVSYKHLTFSSQMHLRTQGRINTETNTGPIPLTVFDLISVFLLWSLGLVIACVSFGFEKYQYRRFEMMKWQIHLNLINV